MRRHSGCAPDFQIGSIFRTEVIEMIRNLINVATLVLALGALGIGMGVTAQTPGQKSRTPMVNSLKQAEATQQPLFVEYKGVRIGMTADEARAKLGRPELQADDQDYYVFADKETAQIAYNAAHKVVGISIDYMGGVGAPDYRNVVGADIDVRADGSMYKLVRYQQLGFWVSYNRTANNSVVIVTITIQKIAF
jgi:hypothetical protein